LHGIALSTGSTYTGHYESIQEMAQLLDEYEKESGVSVPIHCDGASGALFAPFATPSLVWDFRIPRVVSINVSGHKWGKAYVGCGFVIFRDKEHRTLFFFVLLDYFATVEADILFTDLNSSKGVGVRATLSRQCRVLLFDQLLAS
jgi:glutamate decarboxylase